MEIPQILGAAVCGTALMSTVGLQALVAVFSSAPLAKRRKSKNPDFDLRRAYGRILKITLGSVVILAAVTWAVLRVTSAPTTLGYLLGLILGFLLRLPRMSPNNNRNQRHFLKVYADCYEQPEDDLDATREIPAPKKK